MWVIVFGIFSLCQPWSWILHVYGFIIIFVGLIGFIIFSHVKPPAEEEE
jgi:hypothetical protein